VVVPGRRMCSKGCKACHVLGICPCGPWLPAPTAPDAQTQWPRLRLFWLFNGDLHHWRMRILISRSVVCHPSLSHARCLQHRSHRLHFRLIPDCQAAVLAAEEASAAVNSSGPMEDMFLGTAPPPSTTNGVGWSVPGSVTADDVGAETGPGPSAREGATGEPGSGRDWRGSLEVLQAEARPSTAPAAMAYNRDSRHPFARSEPGFCVECWG